jgi:hypothetical protein
MTSRNWKLSSFENRRAGFRAKINMNEEECIEVIFTLL